MAVRSEQKRQNPLVRLGELFDTSALGFLTLLLLAVSLFTTWRGMRDFIASRNLAESAVSEGLIFVIVATLSLAMYVALREMIAPYFVTGWWSAIWKRVVAGMLYATLALWSVGFGYGFWWSLVAGQNATKAALERTINSLQVESRDLRAGLAAANGVMKSAEALSDQKFTQESETGGSCGVNSAPGIGRLARARQETWTQVTVLAGRVQNDWQADLDIRLREIDSDLRLARDTSHVLSSDERKRNFEDLALRTERAAGEINADATALGRTIAIQLRAKADQLSVAPEGGAVSYCYDPDLAVALNAVADELDREYQISVIPFDFAEGPDGVARAIEDLLSRAGGFVGFETTSADPRALEGRDLISLLAAIGVDLALFVFGLLRGSGGRRLRLAQEGGQSTALIGGAQTESIADRGVSREALAPPSEADAEDETIIDAEGGKVAPTRMIETFDPESQLSESEQVAELLARVQHLKEGIYAATLTVERSPLQNKLSDALRALHRLGYLEKGSSDKYYKGSLHKIVATRVSDKPEGYILEIVRPRFTDAEGRLREKALVIVSKG